MVNSYYKNPNEVITGTIENKSVTLSGYQSMVISWVSLGIKGGYNMSYHIYITIDSSIVNFRFNIDELRNNANYSDVIYTSKFYKRSGDAKSLYVDWVKQLEVNINKLLTSYSLKILDSSMTSDEVLTELKKAKEKLDLELITQEEYDELKTELMKYIK